MGQLKPCPRCDHPQPQHVVLVGVVTGGECFVCPACLFSPGWYHTNFHAERFWNESKPPRTPEPEHLA